MIEAFIASFSLPLIWAYYFYKKDCHPEPISYLVFAFFLGIVAVFLSAFFQGLLFDLLKIDINSPNSNPLFLLIAVVIEEFFKFFVVFLLIFPLKIFDEPVDAMIYMIFSAFGFAFVENLFYLIGLEKQSQINFNPLLLVFLRFLSPNFLHIVASALIGFGYAYMTQTRNFLVFLISFLGASFLHFIHNYFIIKFVVGIHLIIPVLWGVFLIVLSEIHLLETKYERRIANLKPYA